MKLKNLCMFFAIGAIALTGCSKDNDQDGPATGNEGDKQEIKSEFDFFLKVNREDLTTRADADQITDGTPVAFNEGALFFVDVNEDVVRYVRITDVYGTGTVKPTQLEDGYLFEGISNTAVMVHIVGNVDFSQVITFDNIRDLDDVVYTYSLFDQSDSDYGVSKATLYGGARLENATSSNATAAGADREAQVLLRPMMARFEIEKISVADSDDPNGAPGSTYKTVDDAFEVKGIYIDNFNYKSSVIGTLSEYNEIPYEYAVSYKKYSRYTPDGKYDNTEWDPILFDDGGSDGASGVNGLGSAASHVIQPQKGAWAYNVFPDPAHITNMIIHLDNVKIWDESANGGSGGYVAYTNQVTGDSQAYLTVTNYKQISTGQAISFEGGYIYVIKDLAFTKDALRDEPKGPGPDPNDLLSVWVEVELMKWTVVPVEVEFN